MPAAFLNIYSTGMYTLCTYAMYNNARNAPAEHKYQDNAVKQTIKCWNRKCRAAHVCTNRKQQLQTVNFAACDLRLWSIEPSDIKLDAE